MNDEMKKMNNSMTPAERQKYQEEMKKQLNDAGKQLGKELKNDVHEKGILGTIFDLVIAVLLSGK